MRIAHVVLKLQTGGQERFILNLSRELVARGHHVSVIALAAGGDLRQDFGPISVIDVPRGGRGGTMGFYARLTRVIRAVQPDVVHTHNPAPLIYGVPSARAAFVPRVIHTKHGANVVAYTRTTLLTARVVVHMLNAFVSVAEPTGETARKTERPPRRIAHVIPNGVPLEHFGADPTARARVRSELGIPEHAVIVGSVGRFAVEKDYPFLVRSMAPLLGEGTRLVLVGEGDQRAAIEAAIVSHVAPEHRRFVRLTGARRDVPDLLAAFDVFALSSMTEGLPLVIPEAMASRLPIVATAVGGLPSIVPSEVGRLVAHGDVGGLTSALSELVHSRSTRSSLGEAAYAYAHERFSLTQMTSKYERLYLA